jgi:glycosyltransferase involved in cell wall biosynthesis
MNSTQLQDEPKGFREGEKDPGLILEMEGNKTMNEDTLKADLHVHSKYSKRPSEWILRKVGCSESYTEPLRLYEIARKRGMDLVTITDHNTLDGSLEIAHLENAFLSEEVTTYFPGDQCKLHVLVYDIDERQHADIARLRENVFDLVEYLRREKIVHALAHPLFGVNEKLAPQHLEQAFLLFQVFEINGTRLPYQNTLLTDILRSLTEEDMAFLADKYDLADFCGKTSKKVLIGGSDDHSSFHIARIYTEVEGACSVKTFLEGLGSRRVLVYGMGSSPKTMAHNIYSVAYQFYKSRFDLERYVSKDLLLRFADRALIPLSGEEAGLMERLRGVVGYRRPGQFFKSVPRTLQGLLQKEGREIIHDNPSLAALLGSAQIEAQEMEEVWYLFVNQISEKIIRQFIDAVFESLSGANLFDIFHSMGSAGTIYTMLAPYFVAYALYAKERRFAQRCRDHFLKEKKGSPITPLKVAHFTDTYYEVNGVALTLQMQAKMALKHNKSQTIVTCGPESDASGVTNFKPIGTFEMPEYLELKLYYPPLLAMLHYCYEESFTHIHSATPGPIGLAALVIARILNLPIYGTYHTALPQYVNHLTEDPAMEEIMWKYAIWYYGQMDVVYVPSQATGEELIRKGISRTKIRFYPRGIDIERFHPSKRNGIFQDRFHIRGSHIKLLYVGRVSREKNLPDLVEIFRRLIQMRSNIHLVIVGEGPYLAEMKSALEGLPVTFTGYLEGEDLPQAYASSDIFVFPSNTDTFGNVVLEAQASGLPVVVTDEGGPHENMVHGKTGLVVKAGDTQAFMGAVLSLIDNRGLLRELKKNSRAYMDDRSFESAYMALWESYRESCRIDY